MELLPGTNVFCLGQSGAVWHSGRVCGKEDYSSHDGSEIQSVGRGRERKRQVLTSQYHPPDMPQGSDFPTFYQLPKSCTTSQQHRGPGPNLQHMDFWGHSWCTPYLALTSLTISYPFLPSVSNFSNFLALPRFPHS